MNVQSDRIGLSAKEAAELPDLIAKFDAVYASLCELQCRQKRSMDWRYLSVLQASNVIGQGIERLKHANRAFEKERNDLPEDKPVR